MKRRTAKLIHESTNAMFWAENPDWNSGVRLVNAILPAIRALPFSLYEQQKRLFFNTAGLLAVSGESVVVDIGYGRVDKHMLRYPLHKSLEEFHEDVRHEVASVTACLGSIALSTSVAIKPVYALKRFGLHGLPVVTQTQQRLDLDEHTALNWRVVEEDDSVTRRDRTARDVSLLLDGASLLAEHHGYYPDVTAYSGNLWRSNVSGAVKLIDVMPFYADGNRLIDDRPKNIVPQIQANLAQARDFVGRYGA